MRRLLFPIPSDDTIQCVAIMYFQRCGRAGTADCTKLVHSNSRQQTHCSDSDMNMNRDLVKSMLFCEHFLYVCNNNIVQQGRCTLLCILRLVATTVMDNGLVITYKAVGIERKVHTVACDVRKSVILSL